MADKKDRLSKVLNTLSKITLKIVIPGIGLKKKQEKALMMKYVDEASIYEIAEEIAQKSGAVTSRNSVIVINTAGTDKSDRLFLLAHEMTHQYQFQQRGKVATEDMAMLEGFADLIANDISGAYISIEDYGIKREDLKSYSDFNEAQKQYGNKVYEQARYYARKEKFLDYY